MVVPSGRRRRSDRDPRDRIGEMAEFVAPRSAAHAHRSLRLRSAAGPHRAASGYRRAMRRGCWSCGRAASRNCRIAACAICRICSSRATRWWSTTRKVIPARLTGRRIGRGEEPRIEATLHKRLDGSRWRAFVRPAKRLARRRRRALRRRGQGLFPRPARRHGRGEGRGRRGDARIRVPRRRCSIRRSRSGATMPLPPYIASQACRRRGGSQRLSDGVRRAMKARSRRRPRGCISPTTCWRGS